MFVRTARPWLVEHVTGGNALFLASPHPVAAAVMRGWLAGGNTIAGVWYPQQQRKGFEHADRRLGLLAPQWSVSAVCGKHRVPITLVPRMSVWPERMEAVRRNGADTLISVYYMNIVPGDIIDHFAGRCVNFHPAPLPGYRGPSPIEAMILDRTLQHQSCMTVHVLDRGTDSGAIIASRPVPFPPDGNLARHTLALAKAARQLTEAELPEYLDGRLQPVPQDENAASYMRVTNADLALSAQLGCDEAAWRCKTYGRKKYLEVSGLGKTRISGLSRKLSAPTGQPPRTGLLFVDIDLADGRVRLKRRRPWTKHLNAASDFLTKISVKDKADADC
jgi:methionyl-tRNA formyltransferase